MRSRRLVDRGRVSCWSHPDALGRVSSGQQTGQRLPDDSRIQINFGFLSCSLVRNDSNYSSLSHSATRDKHLQHINKTWIFLSKSTLVARDKLVTTPLFYEIYIFFYPSVIQHNLSHLKGAHKTLYVFLKMKEMASGSSLFGSSPAPVGTASSLKGDILTLLTAQSEPSALFALG